MEKGLSFCHLEQDVNPASPLNEIRKVTCTLLRKWLGQSSLFHLLCWKSSIAQETVTTELNSYELTKTTINNIIFIFTSIFCFLGSHLWHMEGPKLGASQGHSHSNTGSKLQPTSQLSAMLHPSPWSKARYQTCSLMVPSYSFPLCHDGSPQCTFLKNTLPCFRWTVH